MEIKIIESKDLKEFEKLVNDFFYLINWFDRKPFCFIKETIKKKHIATIIIETMNFKDPNAILIKRINQNDYLKTNPEMKERLEKLINLFYPKENGD